MERKKGGQNNGKKLKYIKTMHLRVWQTSPTCPGKQAHWFGLIHSPPFWQDEAHTAGGPKITITDKMSFEPRRRTFRPNQSQWVGTWFVRTWTGLIETAGGDEIGSTTHLPSPRYSGSLTITAPTTTRL